MNKKQKCSLIVMFDDGSSRGLRMPRAFLVFCIIMLFVMPFVTGLSVWFSYTIWQEKTLWESEKNALIADLGEKTVTIERLQNLSALQNNKENASSLDEANNPPSGDSGSNAVADEPEPQLPTIAPVTTVAENTAQTDDATVASKDQEDDNTAQAEVKLPEDATAPAKGTSSAEAPPPADSDEFAKTPTAATVENPFQEADGQAKQEFFNTGVVRVARFASKLLDQGRLLTTMDLYNAEPTGNYLTGYVTFTLLLKDGKEVSVIFDDKAFRIARLKNVKAETRLEIPPADLDQAVVKLEVYVNGRLAYRDYTPLTL